MSIAINDIEIGHSYFIVFHANDMINKMKCVKKWNETDCVARRMLTMIKLQKDLGTTCIINDLFTEGPEPNVTVHKSSADALAEIERQHAIRVSNFVDMIHTEDDLFSFMFDHISDGDVKKAARIIKQKLKEGE